MKQGCNSSGAATTLPFLSRYLLLGLTLLGLWLGNPLWAQAQPAQDVLSAAALAALLNTPTAPLVLDVRSPAEFQQGHIPGALNIPYRQLPNRLPELTAEQTRPIVVYCEVGVRAAIAEATLEQAGFDPVWRLSGDIRGWQQAGFPLETPSK